MTIASFLLRRRRVLAICAASVLLHSMAISWVGARLGLDDARAPDPEPVTIVAQLRAPQAAPEPLAAPVPAPVSKPRARPARAPRPPAPAPDPGAGLAAVSGTAEAPAPETGAADPAPVVESPPEPVPVPLAEPAPEPIPEPPKPALPAAPRYKASLPPSADLTLDVARTDANGTQWSGRMDMSWKQGGGAYTMKVEASISVLVTRVNLATLTSEGAIDGSGGIAPRTATEKRRGRAQTATHFDAQEKRITFSASERSYPLLPGAQDKATLPLQLAGIARADSAQLAGGVELLVGEDKDANVFHFVVVGQEDIDTAMGTMATWHLSRPPRPGAYNSRLDVWLAPAHNWYPVRIRNTESNGAVTTQTISKIVITDVGH